jgi:hypothetical protein
MPTSRRIVAWCLTLGGLLIPPLAAAADLPPGPWDGERALAPMFRVGDHWSFVTVNRTSGKIARWSREIVALQADGTLLVKDQEARQLHYDAAMNGIFSNGSFRPMIRYPAGIGDAWSGAGAVGGDTWREQVGARVVARETVNVTAGTFDCLRVEAHVRVAVKAFGQDAVHTRWYCPAVRWFAKERVEIRRFDPYGAVPFSNEIIESELASFVPGAS